MSIFIFETPYPGGHAAMKKCYGYFVTPILLLSLLLLLAGCQNNQDPLPNGGTPDTTAPPSAPSEQPQASQNADITQSDMWRVELLSAEFADSLTATLALNGKHFFGSFQS